MNPYISILWMQAFDNVLVMEGRGREELGPEYKVFSRRLSDSPERLPAAEMGHRRASAH